MADSSRLSARPASFAGPLPRPQAAAEERRLPAGRRRRPSRGYRACLRCQPENGAMVTTRLIDTPIGPMLIGATEGRRRPLRVRGAADGARAACVGPRRIGLTVEGDTPLLDRGGATAARVLRRRAPRLRPRARTCRAVRSRNACGPSCAGSRTARRSAIASSRHGSARRPRHEPSGEQTGRTDRGRRADHRVIAADGGLGGYGGGLPAKRRLLDLESDVGFQD